MAASWHPAMMPNSLKDVHKTEQTQTSDWRPMPVKEQTARELMPDKTAIVAHTDIADLKLEDVNREEAPVETAQGNGSHQELDTPLNALATFLSSPGAVELQESPSHNGNQIKDHIEEDDFPLAQFPSDRRRSENKHSSTKSFARTVSEDVNWGEEDEVDPEWNLSNTDTDPFKMMAKSERTNSFPAVPPLHNPVLSRQEESTAPSEAAATINEAGHEKPDLFGDEGNDDGTDFFNQSAGPASDFDISQPWQIGGMKGEPLPNCGRSFGVECEHTEDETQARYEEGLPLMHPLKDPENDSAAPAFLDDVSGEQDGFFTQVDKSEASPEKNIHEAPLTLQRKSTMQVIESFHFQPQKQSEDIVEEPEEELVTEPLTTQRSVDPATDGGGSGIATTVISQVLGVPDAELGNQPRQINGLQVDSGDQGLAEKWKAALAGDEFLYDDDELLPDEDESAANENVLDPSALFGSDDEGFLDDMDDRDDQNVFGSEPPAGIPFSGTNGHTAQTARSGSSGNRYLPAGATTTPTSQSSNSYTPVAPQFTDLSRPVIAPSVSSPYMAAASNFSKQPQGDRPSVPMVQSFANKSKGGYESPYDLPLEVLAKPRKRVSMRNMGGGYSAAPPASVPPPRSSSLYNQPPPRGPTSSLSPPTSSHGPRQAQFPKPVQPGSGFFEDLPVSSKPKPAPRHSNNAPISAHGPQPTSPPQFSPQLPFVPPLQHQQQAQFPPQPSMHAGLVAPERISPYANLPSNPVAPPPATASRYSPAPLQQQGQPHIALPTIPQSRYSPAPIPTPRQQSQNYPPPPPILAHQPRTSSPLAHFERHQAAKPYGAEIMNDRRASSSGYETNLKTNSVPSTTEAVENELVASNHTPDNGRFQPHIPPPPQQNSSKPMASPPGRAPPNLPPQQSSTAPGPPSYPPIRRSMTSSPGSALSGPKLDMTGSAPYQRPASVEVPASPRSQGASSFQSFAPQSAPQTRARGFSQGLNYVVPTDGREHDPLQRWKGAPVFVWGVGGTLITSFPKDVPRYGMNKSMPSIIRSPGEVKIKNIKSVEPLPERLTTFPGPLKGKSKKKEVVAWLTAGIDALEQIASYLGTIQTLAHEDKCIEERVLLWKTLRVFIENDGILEGNPAVDKAVRAVLSPSLDDDTSAEASLYATPANPLDIAHSPTTFLRSDAIDSASVNQLRKHLLRGERESAVWKAVDKRLWAHAMLIANTISRDFYKRVAQEFVQKEVKNTGENSDSLAALYEIFAGNFEESVDELVAPSARAGFQMVSTSNLASPSKDAMDGLDRWRETLGLVLSNRSVDDVQALKALGKLLLGYGRAEAAHICFLFARSVSNFGGIDDPLSSIVLVGSDHLRHPYEFDKEIEPILLSEVYEYGLSLASTFNVGVSYPHLSVYKLQHATILAEYGYREQALQYCDAVAGSVTSQTKRSPYHHALLISALEDLSKRLKQSPKAESSSWLSKPSIDKVSGSVWDKLSKFVAGDDDETAAGASTIGGPDVGPFSRVDGGTPTISRSPSNSDLYGGYNNGLGINAAPISKANSRYAPGRTYTPEPQSGGSYVSQPRSSLEGRLSGEHQRQKPISDHRPSSQGITNSYAKQTNPSYAPQSSYTSLGAGIGPPYAPQPTSSNAEQPPNMYNTAQPMNSVDRIQISAPYNPPESSYNDQPASSGYEPPASSGYEPLSSSGYDPHAPSGYEPPTSAYTPYEPASIDDEPDSPVGTEPKKKSLMDDDDENDLSVMKRVAPGEKTKAEKDREAGEAFRKAAEEDAKRTSATPAKKGWGLGGWFGGGKKEAPDMSAQPNKPIKAKLGEVSSFYYDPDLKRWINKNGGDTAPTPSATPPPPKAGPPRTISGPTVAGPTSVPRDSPSIRSVSDNGTGPSPLTQSDGAGTPPGGMNPALAPPGAPAMSRTVSSGSAKGPLSAPPSRPGTGISDASSIDDLLGSATGGSMKRGAAKKKKGRGYIDVMGEKGS